MSGPTQFLIEHGGPVLFGVVLLEQAGLPLPALPWLVAAGALAASGKVNPFAAVGMAILACLVADSGWFYVGRRNGKRGLGLLCRMSLEPNRCVSRSEGSRSPRREGLVAANSCPGSEWWFRHWPVASG
jgi:membrane protein DedA with SNARE-associated domain